METIIVLLVTGFSVAGLVLVLGGILLGKRCPQCNRTFAVVDYSFACPDCGETATRCVGGDELELSYLEVETP